MNEWWMMKAMRVKTMNSRVQNVVIVKDINYTG